MASMLPAFETFTLLPSSLALILLQCASIHKRPAEEYMLRALYQAQNICSLVAINLMLRPFIRSKEQLCLLDIKHENSS